MTKPTINIQTLKEIDSNTAAEVLDYIHNDLKLSSEQFQNLQDYFKSKYPNENLLTTLLKLRDLKPFAAGGNVFESGQTIDEPTLLCMRWVAGLKMEEVLDILKFDRTDSNLVQDLSVGNIGTAQRWAKTVTGDSLECDNEMMCGRYAKPPRIATFPANEPGTNLVPVTPLPVTKSLDLSSVCSHHFLPYGTLIGDGAYAIVSYIPGDFVLGISKLQRVADHIARRPTIQEDLTKELYRAISEAAQTPDVYVGIFNAKHTCEYLRGSQSKDGALTTEWFGGKFEDKELRESVLRTVHKR
jgi:GTP cyclohydrolase 1|nr:MAG TPA: GTP cyclohydrolase I [Caudoviricetes sp.]